MTPRPFRVADARRRTPPTPGRSTLEPRRGRRRRSSRPGQFMMVYAFGVGEVPISVSGAAEPAGPARAHGARGRRRHAARSARREPGAVLGVRGPFGNAGRSTRRRAATWSSSPAGSASRRCGRSCCTRSSAARDYGRVALLYGAGRRGDLLYADELERVARRDSTSTSTVDAAGRDWAGHGRRRTEAGRRRAASTRRATVAFVCGPEIMMRFTVAGAARARRRRRADLRLAGAQHAVRRRPLRPLPARADAGLPRRARLPVRELAPLAGGAGAVSARRKPKLAVWKFASCDGCQLIAARLRGRAARARRTRSRSPTSSRRRAASSRGRTTSRSSRARSRPRTTPSGSSEVRRVVEGARHDRRLRDRGRHPGAAQLRRRRRVRRRSSTPRPSTSRRSRPRRRSRRTCRSTSSCTAARSTSASCSRSITAFLHGRKPGIPSHERLHRVQAARHRLRHGRARDAVPRPGHARRLRRALPGVQPRLLRLLRPDGDAEHRRADAPAATRARHGRARRRARLPHLQRERAGVPGGGRAGG